MEKKRSRVEKYSPIPKNTQIPFSEYLDSLDKEGIQRTLLHLWECWDSLLSEELREIAIPLGHKKRTLLIGCRDSMEMQDVRACRDDILERVNSFLGKKIFDDLKVSVIIDEDIVIHTEKEEKSLPPKPEPSARGTFLQKMDPKSPIARCYAKYCKQ